MLTVAILFADPKGVYSRMPGCDVWGLPDRDAREYHGPFQVVAHPPCSPWCCLAPINEKRYGHKVGDDGGCFAAALRAVHEHGGVLEHPARSRAWSRFGLPKATRGSWNRGLFDRGWATEVSQRAYGHRATKATWLYYVGDEIPPELDWSSPEPLTTISFLTNHGDSGLPRLSKREASATPPAFAAVLLAMARAARGGAASTAEAREGKGG
jgi:hypothetical protein